MDAFLRSNILSDFFADYEVQSLDFVKEYMYDEFVDDNVSGGMDKLDFDDLIIGKK